MKKFHTYSLFLITYYFSALAFTAQAETVTVDAAAGETVTDEKRTGTIDLSVNTGTDSTGTVILNGENDYTGTTTLGAGTLKAPVLAPLGTASSLGYGTNVVVNGGIFHYSGTTAATCGHAFTFGSGTQKILVDGDLTAAGTWTKTSGTLNKTIAGQGKLTLTGSGNKFEVIKSYGGTFELAGGSTTLTSAFYLYGSTSSEADKMSRLLVTGGSHKWTTKSEYLYVGYPNSTTSDYWAEFIMTGGSLNMSSRNLDLGCNNDNTGTAHVTMDISGGTFTVGRRMFIRYADRDSTTLSDVAITVRDQGKLSVSGDQYFMIYSKAGTLTLTIKDGGQMTMPNICRNHSKCISPTILVDGGTICWNRSNDVFKYSSAAIANDVLIGTKGAVFAGSESSIVATYTDVALAASDTVQGGTAQGVTFQTGTHVLTVANSYAGPTVIKSGATLKPTVAGALPSTSKVTVEQGGTLDLTAAIPTIPGLVLNGNLDIIDGQTLALGSDGITGTGKITIYADAARSTVVTNAGTYPVITVPFAQRASLDSFIQTAKHGNFGNFKVADDGVTATLSVEVPAGGCPTEPTATAIWDGGAGEDTSINTAKNWEGDTVPTFDTGLKMILSTTGSTAKISGEVWAHSIVITNAEASASSSQKTFTLQGSSVNPADSVLRLGGKMTAGYPAKVAFKNITVMGGTGVDESAASYGGNTTISLLSTNKPSSSAYAMTLNNAIIAKPIAIVPMESNYAINSVANSTNEIKSQVKWSDGDNWIRITVAEKSKLTLSGGFKPRKVYLYCYGDLVITNQPWRAAADSAGICNAYGYNGSRIAFNVSSNHFGYNTNDQNGFKLRPADTTTMTLDLNANYAFYRSQLLFFLSSSSSSYRSIVVDCHCTTQLVTSLITGYAAIDTGAGNSELTGEPGSLLIVDNAAGVFTSSNMLCVAGGLGLEKRGVGDLFLGCLPKKLKNGGRNDATTTGPLTVTEGRVVLDEGFSWRNGPVAVNGGTLVFTETENNQIGRNQPLTITGDGIIDIPSGVTVMVNEASVDGTALEQGEYTKDSEGVTSGHITGEGTLKVGYAGTTFIIK